MADPEPSIPAPPDGFLQGGFVECRWNEVRENQGACSSLGGHPADHVIQRVIRSHVLHGPAAPCSAGRPDLRVDEHLVNEHVASLGMLDQPRAVCRIPAQNEMSPVEPEPEAEGRNDRPMINLYGVHGQAADREDLSLLHLLDIEFQALDRGPAFELDSLIKLIPPCTQEG